MLDKYQALAEDIKIKAHGKPAIYIPNPGNWGDGLIRYGTKLFLEDFQIPHHEINIGVRHGKLVLTPFIRPFSKDNLVFIYGGGGAWCSAYPGGRDTVTFISRFTKNFLVLPSTYELPTRISGGTFYRRGLAESANACPASTFCHDMAFYAATRVQQFNFASNTNEEIGVFLRTDLESAVPATQKSLVPMSRDISAEGNHMSCGDSFLGKIAQYRTIFTDRLHIAIAGAIFGADVHLLTGNYFKIREVYEASLRDHFRNVALYMVRDEFLATLFARLGEARP